MPRRLQQWWENTMVPVFTREKPHSSDPHSGEWVSDPEARLLQRYGTLDLEEIDRQQQRARQVAELERDTLKQIKEDCADDTTAAIEALRHYLTEHPESQQARCALIDVLRQVGDFDGAIAICRQYIAFNEQKPSAGSLNEANFLRGEYTIASLLMEKNDVKGAIRYMELFTKNAKVPEFFNALLYRMLSTAYTKEGKPAKAQRASKEAERYGWRLSYRCDGYRFLECDLGRRLTKLFEDRGW